MLLFIATPLRVDPKDRFLWRTGMISLVALACEEPLWNWSRDGYGDFGTSSSFVNFFLLSRFVVAVIIRFFALFLLKRLLTGFCGLFGEIVYVIANFFSFSILLEQTLAVVVHGLTLFLLRLSVYFWELIGESLKLLWSKADDNLGDWT